MNNIKIKSVSIIMLTIIVAVVIFTYAGFSVVAEDNNMIKNLNGKNVIIDEDDLHNYEGVVISKANENINNSVIENFVRDGGSVLVVEDNPESKTLATIKTANSIVPIVAFSENGFIPNKKTLDYEEMLSSNMQVSPQTVYPNAYMYTSVYFYVYANEKSQHVAVVTMKLSIDYFATNTDLSYYNIITECKVYPYNKDYRINSFELRKIIFNDINLDRTGSTTNSYAPVITTSFTHNTGIQTNANGSTIQSQMSVGYSLSYPEGSVHFVDKSPEFFDNQTHEIIEIVPNDGGKYGKSYTAFMVETYRTNSTGDGCGFGIDIEKLDITGFLGKPNYEKSNSDTVFMIASWNKPFTDKSFMIGGGHRGEDGQTKDYFENYNSESSLPNRGSLGGIETYYDND